MKWKNKEERLAFCVEEFDKLYRKEWGRVKDEELVEGFLKKYPDIASELRPRLLFSIELHKAFSLGHLPEERSKRVWQRIKKRLEEIKAAREAEEKVIAFERRTDFLILLLYGPPRRGIRCITRIMKYLFLLMREKGLNRYVKDYYEFALHKFGPFAPELYEDLENLRKEGKVEKVKVRRLKAPPLEKEISDLFEEHGWNIEYRLTNKGIKLAKGLIKGANALDKKIMRSIEEIKTKYARYPLIKLLEYIYETYPEYQAKSIVWKKIKKLRGGEG